MSTKKHKKKRSVLDKKNLAIVVTAAAFVAFIAVAMSTLLPDKAENITFDKTALEESVKEADEYIADTKYDSGLTSVYNEEAVATAAEALPTEGDVQEQSEEEEPRNTAGVFSVPIAGEILNDYSGEELVYSETMQDWRTHNGIDFSAAEGDIVVAAADGTVEAVTDNSMMGTTVIMLHKDGIRSIYSNLSDKVIVEAGTEIPAGTAIGTVGNTAALESALTPHLHFEMSLNEETVNPHDYIGK